jgi:hypothetical protein
LAPRILTPSIETVPPHNHTPEDSDTVHPQLEHNLPVSRGGIELSTRCGTVRSAEGESSGGNSITRYVALRERWETRMRVLTTWIYLEEAQVKGYVPSTRRYRGFRTDDNLDEPGIGIGWFPGDTTDLLTPIDHLKAFRPIRAREKAELSVEALQYYTDLFLLDADEHQFSRPRRSVRNSEAVEYVLAQPFVIERSPPIHVTLKGMINATNLPVWIGTYMGWHVVPDHSVLLFITIPGGIIVVSSAAALANGLSAGLSKTVKKLFRVR